MKGDFARVTFDPARHYNRVFQQQGRVLLEADWNEQAGIQLHLLHTLIRDLVGPCWAVGNGFAMTPQPHLADWQLQAGHFYVDGILCENDAMCTPATQPYAPAPPDGGGDWSNPPASFALWLDVWERHLSAVEAPGIADIALNGIDTATRAQTVWQLRLLDLDTAHETAPLDAATAALNLRLQAATTDAEKAAIKQQLDAITQLRNSLAAGAAGNNNDPCSALRQILGTRATYAWPRLRAQLGPVASDSDPCVIAADARYRGCENQLYRVEVHQGGMASSANAATTTDFKWSRENGSVIFPILNAASNPQSDGSAQLAVSLANLGRDQRLGLAVNDWVELVDDDYTLAQRASPLLQVIAIDIAQRLVTLAVPKNVTAYAVSNDPKKHPLLRRWDQSQGLDAQGCVSLVEGEFIDLEDGVQIRFEPGGIYATGDYWLIPARVAGNGTLDWPQAADGSAAAVTSRGMHHQAVLGIFGAQGAYTECCCRFDSLCALMRNTMNRQPVNNLLDLQPATPAPATKNAVNAPAKTATKKGTGKTGPSG
ncbi:hypothetical protein SAMN05216570_3062 [Dyella sp. OK004]|uniref:DUF6519 domain-containing protein n=1 Tax=Dyella sp. OK004 TaxID=1855292 RepID=UPI0008E7448C|nr:DUF6519 domain-containing protein [Dyella sp. OK004]SFS14319.1 hypothetical protein SAMN05216570_3062 [Dyella sp. OK004]